MSANVVGGANSTNPKQLVVFILLTLPGVYLGKLLAWQHPLLNALGAAAFGIGLGVLILYPSRKGYRNGFDAFSEGRGTGLWWWGWAYGTMCLIGLATGLLAEGTHTP